MKRGPFPFVLAIALWAAWLLLNNSLSTGHLLLGAVLAIFFANSSRSWRPLRPRVKHLYLVVGLFFVVLIDIVKSNVMVAKVVLRGITGGGPGLVTIPLDMRDPHGLAILAMILTATPGTVWVDMDRVQGQLVLHILDIHDEAAWVRTIKDRYERPLMEIFE